MSDYDTGGISVRTVRNLIIGAVVLLALVVGAFKGWENLDAGEIMVVQAPWSGKLTWYTDPGVKWQGFGSVTRYPKRSQYWFSAHPDQGVDADQSIKVRFNDGGHATISGSIAWEMPIDNAKLRALHTKYGSAQAIEQQLVRTVVEKVVYMTGPLMSSKESYAERRNDLLRYIDDQISGGVYRTETHEVKEPDPMTGVMKTVKVVRLVKVAGQVTRQDRSPLADFGIRTFNLSINKIPYDQAVEKQIEAQQQAIMRVQTAMAQAKEAEQAAITAEKNGQAEAAKAKWLQEVVKAKLVTEAQQKLEVATLDKQAAEQWKLEQILRGQGEGERRRLVMQADGALQQKLDAWKEVNFRFADALKDIKQPLVPHVQFGAGSGTGQTGVQDLISIFLARTAQQLAVDVTPGRTN